MPRKKKPTKKKTTYETCANPACDGEAICVGYCSACYARMHYWHNRSIKAKVNHMKRLKRCEATMDMELGNVKTMTPKKAKTG